MCQRKFLEYEYGASLRYTRLYTFRIRSLTFPLKIYFLFKEIMHVLKSIPNENSFKCTVDIHCRWIKDYLVLHSACTPK